MRARLATLLATAIAMACTIVASGCATLPDQTDLKSAPPPHVSPMAPGGLADQRARFRDLFCATFEQHRRRGAAEGECSDWLWQLADEPAPDTIPLPSPGRLQVYLITGAFSECFGGEARPFGVALPELATSGHVIDTIVVGGRSGTEHNARQIADYLSNHPPAPALPVVMIGYSKGINDALEFLIAYPDLAKQVDAVVSLAGSVAGSALAMSSAGLYDVLLARLPSEACEAGDGEVVDSLRVDNRRRWLEQHPLPRAQRYFSIGAFATRERVARVLVPSWKWLLDSDVHNDAQLLTRDALLPGSILLGYLHADHWAVAIAVEQKFDTLAARQDPRPFPQGVLLESILLAVGESLEASGHESQRAERRQ